MSIKLVAPIEQVGAEDAVIYNPQTLTDEQKAQARENIGAEPLYGGLRKKTYTYPTLWGTTGTKDLYLSGKGDVLPLPEDATDEIKTAYGGFMLDLSSWTTTYNALKSILDNEIMPLYNAGLLVPEITIYPDAHNLARSYVLYENGKRIGFRMNRPASESNYIGKNLSDGSYQGYDESRAIMAYASSSGNDAPCAVRQFVLSAEPTEDMHVATKKYVDSVALPTVSTTDNGKILKVVDGVWTAADA